MQTLRSHLYGRQVSPSLFRTKQRTLTSYNAAFAKQVPRGNEGSTSERRAVPVKSKPQKADERFSAQSAYQSLNKSVSALQEKNMRLWKMKTGKAMTEEEKSRFLKKVTLVKGVDEDSLLPYLDGGGYAEVRWPKDVVELWFLILNGNEVEAWSIFNRFLKAEEEGKEMASIWHWFVMINLVARDDSIAPRDVFKMACWDEEYQSSAIYRSLRDKEEMGGALGHQQIIAFSMMHGFQQRGTENASEVILSLWTSFMKKVAVPTARLVNQLCVALIQLGRKEDAIRELIKWAQPQGLTDWTPPKEGAILMNDYTVGMLMFAFYQNGLPSSAYGIFQVGTGEMYKVKVNHIHLDLLLLNARLAHRGYLLANNMEEEGSSDHDVTSIADEKRHWKQQMMWDGVPSVVKAQRIFKSYIFTLHPELINEKNPLYDYQGNNGSGLMWRAHAQMQRWQNIWSLPSASHQEQVVEDKEEQEEEGGTPADEMKRSNSKLDSHIFEQYLRILPFVNVYNHVAWEEYLIVLAWMKKLAIEPNHYSLMRICWAIDHLVPPAGDLDNALSAAGPLHDYLVEWLGEDKIPSQEEVGYFIASERNNYNLPD